MTSRKSYSPWRTRAAILASGFAAFGAFTVAKAAVAEAAVPTVSVYNTHKNEGNAGNTLMPFTVKLSFASGQEQSVQLQPGVGGPTPATAAKDFNSAGPYLVKFLPGETSKVVNVPVYGDTLHEANETFALRAVWHTNGVANGDIEGIGQITNDDAAPSISINDVAKKEGTGGITPFTFSVKLSAPSGTTVKVNAVGLGMSAAVPADLTAGPADLVFNPGVTLRTYTAHVNGDSHFEANETFRVSLSNAVNATIADTQGVGTIQNDDPAQPQIDPKPDPKPEPQPQPQPPADNGGNDGGGNSGGGTSGGGFSGGSDAGASSDNGVAGGEGEQALGETALTESQPAHRSVDWMTSAMLILLGACALGLIIVAFMISRNRRRNA